MKIVISPILVISSVILISVLIAGFIFLLKLLRKIRMENRRRKEEEQMEFFAATIAVLKIVLTAIGAGIGIWGVVELLESYGDGGGSSRSKGIKQLMSGGGIIIVAQTVIPLMANLFTTTPGG